MAVAPKVLLANGAGVSGGGGIPLPSFSFPGMPLGFIVADSNGQNWQLTISSATVDHTSVEKCGVNPALRWLVYSGGGGSGLNQLTGDVTAGPGTGSQAATLANLPASVLATRLKALTSSAAGIEKVDTNGNTSIAIPGQDYLAGDWYNARLAPIKAIEPTLVNIIPLDSSSVTKDFLAQAAVGSGLVKPDQTVPGGGIIYSSGGAAGNGNMNLHVKDYNAANPPGYGINMKTDPWALMIRFQQNTAIDANAECAWINMYDGSVDIMVGAIGAGSTANVSLYADGGAGNRTDTTQALDVGNPHDGVLFFDKNGLKNGTPTLWWVQDDVFTAVGMTNLANFGTNTLIDFRDHSFGVNAPARTFTVWRRALVTRAIK